MTTLALCFDCDNTLLDNDALKADLDAQLHALLGAERARIFWEHYEAARSAEGTVDFPATIARVRPSFGDALADAAWRIIWDYPFADRLYPASLAVLAKFQVQGVATGIVSDGDLVYQPHKIAASGLAAAVGDRVRIYVHKQEHLDAIAAWLPADRYVFVDDKPQLLAKIKRQFGGRALTLHVRQGHYAADRADPAPDLAIAAIGDMLALDLLQLATR